MIKKVEMYTVICDGCGKDSNSDTAYAAWSDITGAEDVAACSDWEKDDEKHYCPDCYEYDDNDELIFKIKTKTK
jgi:hypothetical protein